jgi:hypothetical protein
LDAVLTARSIDIESAPACVAEIASSRYALLAMTTFAVIAQHIRVIASEAKQSRRHAGPNV